MEDDYIIEDGEVAYQLSAMFKNGYNIAVAMAMRKNEQIRMLIEITDNIILKAKQSFDNISTISEDIARYDEFKEIFDSNSL